MLEKAGGPGHYGAGTHSCTHAVAQPSGKSGVRSLGHWGMTPRGQGPGHACLLGPRGNLISKGAISPSPATHPLSLRSLT